jgi:EcsC family protein
MTVTAGRTIDAVPRLPVPAPDLNASFVDEALHRAIHGIRPLAPARDVAESARDVDAIIDDHVRLAGAQGMVTSVGGVFTAMVMVPANIAGLALLQLRMVAAIAHRRGYDLADPRTHNAVLACLLGEDKVDALVLAKKVPATPMALATAPVHDPEIARVLAAEVTAELAARVGGKRAALAAVRKVPLVGGIVGMGADGVATYLVGSYAAEELRPRNRR